MSGIYYFFKDHYTRYYERARDSQTIDRANSRHFPATESYIKVNVELAVNVWLAADCSSTLPSVPVSCATVIDPRKISTNGPEKPRLAVGSPAVT